MTKRKRKTPLDHAIADIDNKILTLEANIEAMKYARQQLVAHQRADRTHADDGPVVVDRSVAHQRGVS